MNVEEEIVAVVAVMYNLYAQYMRIRGDRLAIQRRRALLIAALLRRRRERLFRRVWKYVNSQFFWERDVTLWPEDKFHSVFRMGRDTCNMLSADLGPVLSRRDSQLREAIGVEKRIAIAVFFLKSGADYGTIGLTFGVGKSTVHSIVEDFCTAVLAVYRDKIRFPETEEEMRNSADEFLNRWQFPGVLGALDGCHIPIRTPSRDGADYFNYKGWHSIILLAVVSSRYRFIYTHVGFPGRVNDSGVLRGSSLWDKLTGGDIPPQYHLLGDAAFPLAVSLLKPYQGNVDGEQGNFNYRLSRARMVVENAFGRLKGRWRVLLKQIDTDVPKAVIIISTCCILHNICEERRELLMGEWENEVEMMANIYPQPDANHQGMEYVDGVEKRLSIMRQLT